MPPVFDGHNDTLTHLYILNDGDPQAFLTEHEDGQIDLPRAQQADFGGGFFAIFVSPPLDNPEIDAMYGVEFTEEGYITAERSPIEQEYAEDFTDTLIDFAYEIEAASEGQVQVVKSFRDLVSCLDQNILAMVLHLEGAEAIQPDLSNLERFYDRGVRSIGLVWSRPNAFGVGVPFIFPSGPDTGPGLTDEGKALVRACNDLGIMIDMAHLNEKGFWDVAQISNKPLVVTHADVYAICPSSRNLTDAQIDAIGETGGVIGINFEAMNTSPTSDVNQDVPLTQITAHIDYIVQRIGIDHVAFGSDFDGAEMPNDLHDVTGVPLLIQTLREGGYDDEAINKMAYGNWLRVLEATWRE